MASKDKTSKTARVMNLLSKKADPAAEEAPETTGAPAAPAAPTPPIVTSMAPDVAVSAQIKNALEDALEGELAQQQTPAAPTPAQEAAPAAQPAPAPPQEAAPMSQPEPAPVPVQKAAPAPQPEPESIPAQEAAPAPQPEPAPAPVQEAVPAPQPEPAPAPAQEAAPTPQPEQKWTGYPFPTYPGYINVMQVLVEEKAPRYVKMFGLCSCNRCMEDVKAITLNHLPSKYVVLEQGDLIPRLTVYEGQFSSDITAQLLKACKMVMERPHHGR